ncbi:MAG: hypothetical protein JXA68_11290 [Ignavibacteriales bacterium]|nr:hypothetical protein [Ignavibacteriales bacterium]
MNKIINDKDSIITIQDKELNEKSQVIENLKNKLVINEKISSLNHSGSILLKSENKDSIFQYIFPSLIALIVGLFALFGTIYSGKRQQISSEKQLKEQLKQSQITVQKQIQSSKETINAQIASAKEIAESQLKTAYDTAQLTFRQNVLSSNRKDWIEKLRNNISVLSAKMLIVAFKKNKVNSDYEDIIHLVGYIELMLNANDPRDKELVVILLSLPEKIINYPVKTTAEDLGNIRRELLAKSKSILKSEWERVKKGE